MTTTIETRLVELFHETGELTPAVVVADARRPESPLHGLFEWDPEKAHEQYLLMRAREVIRSVRITITTPDDVAVRVRGLTNVPGRGYMPTREVLDSPDLAQKALDQMRRELALLKARNRQWAHLFPQLIPLLQDPAA